MPAILLAVRDTVLNKVFTFPQLKHFVALRQRIKNKNVNI